MQESVDSQDQQLLLQGVAQFFCLRLGGFRGNQDFTFRFLQREAEYIGRPVVAQELSVINGNFLVAYQDNTQLPKR